MVEYSDQKGNIKFFSYAVLVGCYLIELSMTTVSKCLCAFTVEDIVKLLLTVYIYIIFAADSKLESSLIGSSLKDNSKYSIEKKFGQETEAKVRIVNLLTLLTWRIKIRQLENFIVL